MDKRKEANLRVKNSITQTVLRLLDKKVFLKLQFLKSSEKPGWRELPFTETMPPRKASSRR